MKDVHIVDKKWPEVIVKLAICHYVLFRNSLYQVDNFVIQLLILNVLFENLTFYEWLGPLDSEGNPCTVHCPEYCITMGMKQCSGKAFKTVVSW